jgi:hypothetical protein
VCYFRFVPEIILTSYYVLSLKNIDTFFIIIEKQNFYIEAEPGKI